MPLKKYLNLLISLYERTFVKNLSELENPRLKGESLTGNLSKYWKYRIGDYRLICRIEDEKLLVLIVKIGHRREVYKF